MEVLGVRRHEQTRFSLGWGGGGGAPLRVSFPLGYDLLGHFFVFLISALFLVEQMGEQMGGKGGYCF